MTAKPKKAKLPAVWVVMYLDHISFASRLKPAPWSARETVHKYVPATKPRICRWEEDETGEYWIIGCMPDRPYQIEGYLFCPFCGGKIKQ